MELILTLLVDVWSLGSFCMCGMGKERLPWPPWQSWYQEILGVRNKKGQRQFCLKGPRGPDRQQAEREPAVGVGQWQGPVASWAVIWKHSQYIKKVITCLCSAPVGLRLERSTLLDPWHENKKKRWWTTASSAEDLWWHGLQHLPGEERLMELVLFGLGKG